MRLRNDKHEAPPLNSPLETGIRALVLLDALYPRACSLTEMTWFDHLVVHTGDLDGPSSLHPDLPGREGEIYVRRTLIESSLRLMHQAHLVDVLHHDDGIYFIASEDAPSFLELLQAPYTLELKHRARWISEQFSGLPTNELQTLIQDKVGRWTAEFQTEGPLMTRGETQ